MFSLSESQAKANGHMLADEHAAASTDGQFQTTTSETLNVTLQVLIVHLN